VQLLNSAREALPNLDADIAAGEFGALLGWLRENIHCHGSKFTPRELVQRVTGGEMDSRPYMRYLREKYSDIYAL
jgi:carboxypeptidase Taq